MDGKTACASSNSATRALLVAKCPMPYHILKKDAVDLKCKNRRLQQSVEDAEVFLSDLDYCSSDWKEAQAKLKESLDHFNIEMISAFIYVFLLGKSFVGITRMNFGIFYPDHLYSNFNS